MFHFRTHKFTFFPHINMEWMLTNLWNKISFNFKFVIYVPVIHDYIPLNFQSTSTLNFKIPTLKLMKLLLTRQLQKFFGYKAVVYHSLVQKYIPIFTTSSLIHNSTYSAVHFLCNSQLVPAFIKLKHICRSFILDSLGPESQRT